jgi:hypothetical protein
MTDTEQPKKKLTRFITPVLALVAVLAVGLISGVFIGKNTATATTAGGFDRGTMTGEAPTGTAGGMGGFTSGTIVSVDGDTITLELEDGSTVTISTADDTTVTTTQDSTVGELAEGDSITVVGEADDDGNVSATSISEGSTGFGGFGGGGTPPTTGSDG